MGNNNSRTYRKIYETHYGPIPLDDKGRTYEIHHIDGDHTNNDVINLRLVTIEEHYQIHYDQGDYGACFYMAQRMNLTRKEKSDLSRKSNEMRVQNKTHNFLGGKISGDTSRRRVLEGTHIFLDPEVARKSANDRVALGIHQWLGGDVVKKQIENGEHPSQIKVSCLGCYGVFGKGQYGRYHGKKCKTMFKEMI